MVTRITISQTAALSADIAHPQVMPKPSVMEYRAKEMVRIYTAYAGMLSYVMRQPNSDPKVLIEGFCDGLTIEPKVITKSKRTYSIWGITITKEDN